MLEFEWDEDKAESNLQKHRVPFTEAATVFGDDLASTVYDSDHTEDEDRYITIGMSVTGQGIDRVSYKPQQPNSPYQR